MMNIGYVAAAISCCAFGSFAVPIKGKAANKVNIDPLVMQTYKTIMCFLTSWLVLLVGIQFQFTPWGMVSGICWVPGGTAGIYAVRNAGLALSQGTWSTLKIMVGFIWGIFIFHERVRSIVGAVTAISCMISGLCGMSYFASFQSSKHHYQHQQQPHQQQHLQQEPSKEKVSQQETVLLSSKKQGNKEENDDEPFVGLEDAVEEDLFFIESAIELNSNEPESCGVDKDDKVRILDCLNIQRRKLGILCACFDGLWGGSILVPMHFAKTTREGLGFAISFSIGATTVLITMWLIRFTFDFASQTYSIKQSWERLPSLHLSSMWLPGGIAGLLWSIGNLGSMVSVAFLGEGVGYSIVQAQMLVAGLWGIIWYQEIQGWYQITGWFLCAGITFSGIVLLSYEHQKG